MICRLAGSVLWEWFFRLDRTDLPYDLVDHWVRDGGLIGPTVWVRAVYIR